MIKGLLVALAIVLLILFFYPIVKMQQMSDADREAYGHGPKGQGR